MKKLSLNSKIYFVLSIFVFASVLISSLGLYKMSRIYDGTEHISKTIVKRIRLANQIRAFFRTNVINEKNYILEDSKEARDHLAQEILADQSEMFKRAEDYLKLSESESGRKKMLEFRQAYETWFANDQEVLKIASAGKERDSFALSRTHGKELRLEAEKHIQEIIELNQKQLEDATEHADQEYIFSKYCLSLISAAAILSGVLIAFFVLRSTSRAINGVISSLTQSSTQVSTAASDVASASEELSQSTTEQAASLQETSSAIEEVKSMVTKNSENASRVAAALNSSQNTAVQGKEVVERMMRSIGDISQANEAVMAQTARSNERISEFVTVIRNIGEKTKVINDIVFQTKLLSFNASVEAARAGEHGKGFAVVAEEVGSLAQMSGKAASEISTMLSESIHKVEAIVAETKNRVEGMVIDAKSKVDAGSEVARQCGVVLDEIVVQAAEASRMSEEIANASQEQAQGVQEITRAIAQMDEVTQLNAQASRLSSSSAESLSLQSLELRQMVSTLAQTIHGEKSGGTPKAQSQPGAELLSFGMPERQAS